MKKVLLLSGLLTVILLSMSLTGLTDKDDSVKEAMWLGNKEYESGAYDEALLLFESGFEVSPDDESLNFNAAQAAYLLGEYGKAEEYYGKSGDNIERFLNVGNIYAALGDSVEENEQKLQSYLQALKYYQEGIVMFPQNVPLKYNYEIVKGKAEDIAKDMNQQDNEQDDSESDNDESQEQDGQEQDSQEQEGQEQDDQEQDSQEQGENSEDQDQDQDSQDAQEDEGSAQEQEGQEQEQAQGQAEGEDGEQDVNSGDENEIDLDREAIERILKMLEIQEEESLKNNQEVVGGKDGKYGW